MKPRTAIPQGDQLVPDSVVWTEFGVTRMALYRWDRDPDLNLRISPIYIRRRKYRSRRALEKFKEQMVRSAIAERNIGKHTSKRKAKV